MLNLITPLSPTIHAKMLGCAWFRLSTTMTRWNLSYWCLAGENVRENISKMAVLTPIPGLVQSLSSKLGACYLVKIIDFLLGGGRCESFDTLNTQSNLIKKMEI